MRRSPLENFRHSHFPVADDSSITFNEVKRKFLFEEYYFYRKKMNMSLFMKTLIQKKKRNSKASLIISLIQEYILPLFFSEMKGSQFGSSRGAQGG